MASYLQGVTDYIPQFQPFQPDLNLYANVLQTKQTQYDTAWKSLNNVYGQYFYSDLTRDNNIERKDEILKNIDFNLKRVSALDLSLDQNINQAVQVFKPFYEDKYLMKDMAWTKNYTNQKGRAEGLKNSDKEDVRAQYWNDGVKAMDYMREEFRGASDNDSLSFQNAEYTPYVNVTKLASKIAKDAGLSVEKVDFSEDGRWIIKNTNGEQLIEPLSKLFEAQLGNDPAVQAVYQTQAYVNRKDYAYANAAQFGGDKNAAEMSYLENSFNVLKEQNQMRYKSLQDSTNVYQTQIDDIKKQIANGTATPKAKMALAQYEQALQINNSVLDRVEKENDMLNEDRNGTATTSGFINPYGDIKSLRYKVDNGMASMLMQKDLDEAAEVFAYKGAKVDIDANPYAVKAEEHSYRMQEANLRGQYMLRAAEMRNKSDKEVNMDKHLVDRGTHRYDTERLLPDGTPNPNYGKAVAITAFENVITERDDEGVTGKINSREMDLRVNQLHAQQITPAFNDAINLVQQLVTDGVMTSKQANNIFGMDYTAFSRQLAKDPTWFLTRSLGADKLTGINNRLKSWVTKNSQLSGLTTNEFKAFEKSSMAFEDYSNYVKASQKWKKESSTQVEQELAKLGFKYAKYLYDQKGNIRSLDDFYNIIYGTTAKAKNTQPGTPREKGFLETLGDVGLSGGGGGGSGLALSPEALGINMKDVEGIYSSLRKAAANVYTSGKIPVKNVVSVEKFGNLSGTGKFTTGKSTTFINPKGHDTRSMALFGETLKDLKNFDWEDDTKNRVSLSGISAADWENYGGNKSRNNIGKTLLSAIQAEVSNPKTKMGNFKLQVAPIAGGSISKAAIIITPDAEWLKQYVWKTDKDGKKIGEGIISPSQYDYAINNGISYIMDAKNMSNTMYVNAYSSPLKSYIDSNGSYTNIDMKDPNNTFTITPSKLGTGGYDVDATYPVYYPNTNEIKYETTTIPGIPDPDAARQSMFDYRGLNEQAMRGGY